MLTPARIFKDSCGRIVFGLGRGLVPEVWQAVAHATEVEGLLKTTRDIPVYEDLMKYRLELLEQHDITLSTQEHRC